MKKIFLDMHLTGFHRDTTVISIGLVADTKETFYAELNDYDTAQIDEWTGENVRPNLFYAPPPKGEQEYWTWTRNNHVRMRGNKEEVRRYLSDWLQALLGGPQSSIEYEKGKRPEEIEEPSIEIWGYSLCYDWVLLCDLWGSSGMTIPKCLHRTPFDIAIYVKSSSHSDGYLALYEMAKKQDALSAAKAIQVLYSYLKTDGRRAENEN